MRACELCSAAGRQVPATRILPGDRPVCTEHAGPITARYFDSPPPDLGEPLMDNKREIDLPAVQKDLDGGMSVKAAAGKFGVPETTLRSRLKRVAENGATPARVAEKRNGQASGELESFLDEQWRGLSVLERVQVLLWRVSPRA